MKVREIPLSALQPKDFIKKKMADIAADVKNGIAINALSGSGAPVCSLNVQKNGNTSRAC